MFSTSAETQLLGRTMGTVVGQVSLRRRFAVLLREWKVGQFGLSLRCAGTTFADLNKGWARLPS
jgi:hypothetical protein